MSRAPDWEAVAFHRERAEAVVILIGKHLNGKDAIACAALEAVSEFLGRIQDEVLAAEEQERDSRVKEMEHAEQSRGQVKTRKEVSK